eukprot:7065624-Ditylum_brightwellii.AAC.1
MATCCVQCNQGSLLCQEQWVKKNSQHGEREGHWHPKEEGSGVDGVEVEPALDCVKSPLFHPS